MYGDARVFDDDDVDMRPQKSDQIVIGNEHLIHMDRTDDGEDNDGHIDKMAKFHVELDFRPFQKGHQYLSTSWSGHKWQLGVSGLK